MTADYERFLRARTEQVLPYFGGAVVDAPDRRLRLRNPDGVETGWWLFVVEGRVATAEAPHGPPDLSGLPAIRGHAVQGALATDSGDVEPLLLSSPEPPRFAPVVARRWPTGELLFDAVDFETGVEERARQAFDDGGTLDGVRGVPASLRHAFAVSVLVRVAAERGMTARPREARAYIGAIAKGGATAAGEALDDIAARRRATPRPVIPEASWDPNAWRNFVPRPPAPVRRAAAALDKSGAALLDHRLLSDELLEVRYRFMGERFVSVVDSATLQVYDAGICLAGEDRQLTLDSLPSVIREAIEKHRLVVTSAE